MIQSSDGANPCRILSVHPDWLIRVLEIAFVGGMCECNKSVEKKDCHPPPKKKEPEKNVTNISAPAMFYLEILSFVFIFWFAFLHFTLWIVTSSTFVQFIPFILYCCSFSHFRITGLLIAVQSWIHLFPSDKIIYFIRTIFLLLTHLFYLTLSSFDICIEKKLKLKL